jgi:cytochrome b561
MLLSGPLMVWSAGEPIRVFALTIPSPLARSPGLHDAMRDVHGLTASFLLLGIALHVLAVFEHVILNRDGTFDKIMIAGGVPRD